MHCAMLLLLKFLALVLVKPMLACIREKMRFGVNLKGHLKRPPQQFPTWRFESLFKASHFGRPLGRELLRAVFTLPLQGPLLLVLEMKTVRVRLFPVITELVTLSPKLRSYLHRNPPPKPPLTKYQTPPDPFPRALRTTLCQADPLPHRTRSPSPTSSTSSPWATARSRCRRSGAAWTSAKRRASRATPRSSGCARPCAASTSRSSTTTWKGERCSSFFLEQTEKIDLLMCWKFRF